MESNKKLITEKGIDDPSQVSQHYLGPISAEVERARPYLVKSKAVKELIRNISYRDIRWKRDGQTFYPLLPDAVIAGLSELRQLDASKTQAEFGTWTTASRNGSIAMRCQRDDSHRSHFPNGGIPSSLRGLGLGSKLYRALIETEKYVTSDSLATPEAQRAWQSVIKKKQDPQEDLHVIMAPSNKVLAMIKTISDSEKIRITKLFLNQIASLDRITNTNFAIDDELKAILPQDVLVLIDPVRREEAARIRREQEEQERIRRDEELRRRAGAALAAYGLDPNVPFDHNWNVGDYIVVKSYLVQTDYDSVPIRKVTALNGNSYTAIELQNAEAGTSGEARSTENTPTGKAAWVKINITRVQPDNIRSSTANKAAVRQLQRRIEAGEVAATPTSSTATTSTSTSTSATPNNVQNAYTGTMETFQGRKDQFANRPRLLGSVRRKIKDSEYFYLVGDQIDKYRSNQTCEVCIAVQRGNTPIKLFSTVTHQTVETTFRNEDDLKQFASRNPHIIMLVKVTALARKTDLRVGEMMFIAKQNTLMGVCSPVDYYLLNSAQNKEFVYVKAYSRYDENGSFNRNIRYKVPVRLDYAKKLEVVLAESITYVPKFGEYVASLKS